MNTSALFIGGLGATELLIIGAVIVMMFGATKLPELARGSGQALRIFKSETKGLHDDDAATKPSAVTQATTAAEPTTTESTTVHEPIVVTPEHTSRTGD